MGGRDPTVIRSLAVSRADVVDAYVYTRENPGTAVLRVTPPFHGRMRARLHVYRVDDATATGSIHVPPKQLLESTVVDTYPRLEAFATDADATRVYGEAVAEWRERARYGLRESTAIETEAGAKQVAIKPLE